MWLAVETGHKENKEYTQPRHNHRLYGLGVFTLLPDFAIWSIDIDLKYSQWSAVLVLIILLLISGCKSSPEFHVKNLMKSDIDQVSDIHLQQTVKLLKTLTVKLYKRNPAELKKESGQTIETRLEQIFTCPVDLSYETLEYKEGTEAMLLGLDQSYTGDRVFAVMYGLYTMIHKSYDSECELYLLDYLDEQSLYNCARNIEILAWRLKHRKTAQGDVLLLTNHTGNGVENLSYERLFGKLIALQDNMAVIVSLRTGRYIREAVQTVGMAFLPIPI